MRKPRLKVIFDTNVFQPGNFDLLAASPFRDLCRVGAVTPLYGHVFLEEMWRSYGHERKRTDLVEKWIPFIVETVDRFFEDFDTIWHRELVQGHGRTASVYMRARYQQNLVRGLSRVTVDGSWPAWHGSQAELAQEHAKRNAQREASKAIRQDVAEWKARVGYRAAAHGGPLSFDRVARQYLVECGKGFIAALVERPDARGIADRWARAPDAYPYFTTFVRNMMYMGYHAATRPDAKIDINAQADLDLMSHLLMADVLVSNETGFLRRALGDLWRPKGKVLMSSEEFARYLPKLA